ncbi:MAG: PRC-barrel domain containing protein [Anaerolineae bacterium]|nr:PRC-barrel domain containing protein [Anaerolineae bacterium]
MLRSADKLKEYTVQAPDGPVGTVKDFYFDDENWIIRYLVVDTDPWLSRQDVLLSPEALTQPDWARRLFPVKLSQAQVKQSPAVDTTRPISRRQEAEMRAYYHWPIYWTPGRLLAAQQTRKMAAQPKNQEGRPEDDQTDSHLRSATEVTGYHLWARDGVVGHVEDFIIDDQRWEIDYLVIGTRNWLPGKKVLISPSWIEEVSWPGQQVHVDLARETIKNSPEYDPSTPINEGYQERKNN